MQEKNTDIIDFDKVLDAKYIGMNASVLRQYVTGLAVPRGKNREIIRRGLNMMAARLSQVSI